MTASHRPSADRRGFTLVELLVVIMIIATLAALLTPVVMRSLASARNSAIKAEIDMLHMAVMNYKNEYGSFPPCIDAVGGTSGLVSKHLLRVFPRMPAAALPNPAALTPATALVSWLAGFTDNPLDPMAVMDGTQKRKPLYDFDRARISSLAYAPASKPDSPYIYIPSTAYAPFISGGKTYFGLRQPNLATLPFWKPGDPDPFSDLNQEPFNPDTFQILCAGRDEQFGTDDDLSNFWPGTRKEYLDSLK